MNAKEAKALIAPAFKHQIVTLTDAQIDELIAAGDSETCFNAFLVCKFSEEAGAKLKRAAYGLMKKKPHAE